LYNQLILIGSSATPAFGRKPAKGLGLQGLAAATWMVALARKLGQILCVLAGLAAVLLMVRGNTTTSGVGALLGFGHFGFSWGCLLKLLF
jgi:hypothetical protein